MDIEITSRHTDLSEALKQHINDCFKKIDTHTHIEKIKVVINVENKIHEAETIVHYLGKDYFASAKDPDMYHSIELAAKKIDVQVKKRKDTIVNKHGN